MIYLNIVLQLMANQKLKGGSTSTTPVVASEKCDGGAYQLGPYMNDKPTYGIVNSFNSPITIGGTNTGNVSVSHIVDTGIQLKPLQVADRRPCVHNIYADTERYLVHLALRQQIHPFGPELPTWFEYDEYAADVIWHAIVTRKMKLASSKDPFDKLSLESMRFLERNIFHGNMRFYQEQTRKTKTQDTIFNNINALFHRIKEGSFNPYGNGQTAYERRQQRRQLEKATLPQEIKDILNEEMDRIEDKENTTRDIKHGRSLNYFKRDFDQVNQRDKTNLDLDYTVDKFIFILKKQGYDVCPTIVSSKVITKALSIFIQTGILMEYGHLKKKIEEGYKMNFSEKKKGKSIRKLLIKYLYLIEVPEAVHHAIKERSQSFFSDLMTMAIDEAIVALKNRIIEGVHSSFQMIKDTFVSLYQKLVEAFSGSVTNFMIISILAGVVLFVLIACLLGKFAVMAFEWFTGYLRKDEEIVHAQAGEAAKEFIAASVCAWKGFKDFSVVLSALNTSIVSVKNTIDFIKTSLALIQQAIDYVYEELFGEPLTQDGTMRKALRESHKYLVEIVSTATPKDVYSPHWAREFIKHYKVVVKSVSLMKPKDQNSKEFVFNVQRMMREWSVTYQLCVHTVMQDEATQDRTEPVALYFYGKSGAGKTYGQELIMEILSQRWRKKKMTAGDKYVRNILEEFHSGYHGQWATMLDEFLQSSDSQTRIKAALEFIAYVNTSTMSLIMPGLNEKGITKFCSELVVATSNDKAEPLVAIQSCEAMWRRYIAIEIKENKKMFKAVDGEIKIDQTMLDENYKFDVTHYEEGDVKKRKVMTNIDFSDLLGIIDARRNFNLRKANEKFVVSPELRDATFEPPTDVYRKINLLGHVFKFQSKLELDEFAAVLQQQPGANIDERLENYVVKFKDTSYAMKVQNEVARYCETYKDLLVEYDTEEKEEDPDYDDPVVGQMWFSLLGKRTETTGDINVRNPFLKPTLSQVSQAYYYSATQKLSEYIQGLYGTLRISGAKNKIGFEIIMCLRYSKGAEILKYLSREASEHLLAGNYGLVVKYLEAKMNHNGVTFTFDDKASCQTVDYLASGKAVPPAMKKAYRMEQVDTNNWAIKDEDPDQRIIYSHDRITTIEGLHYFDFWSIPQKQAELWQMELFIKDQMSIQVQPTCIAIMKAKYYDKVMYYTGIVGMSVFAIAAAAIAIQGITMLFGYVMNVDVSSMVFGQSENPFTNKYNKLWNKKRSVRSGQLTKGNNKIRAQTNAYFTSTAVRVAHNTKLFKFSFSSGKSMFSPGCFYHERVVAFPGHLFFEQEKDFTLEMYLFIGGRDELFSFNASQLKIKVLEDRDIALVMFPTTVPSGRSLLHMMKSTPPSNYHHVTRISFDDLGENIVMFGSSDNELLETATYALEDNTIHINPLVVVAKGCQGFAGECGFVYIENEPTVKEPIVGIHIAGKSSLSYIAPIFRGDIESFIKESAPVEIVEMPVAQCGPWFPEELKYEEKMLKADIPYPVVGELQNPIYQPSKTTLQPSILALGTVLDGKEIGPIDYPRTLAPAKLKPEIIQGELKDPLILAFRKAKGRVRTSKPEHIEDEELWLDIFPKFKWEPLTMETCMDGIPGRVASAETSTSAGDPFVQQGIPVTQVFRKSTDKGGRFIHPKIEFQMKMFEQACVERKLFMPNYIVYLKDELRTIQKVTDFFSRAFYCAPKWFILKWKQYFGLWMAEINKDTTNPIKVGINPFSTEWWSDFYKIYSYSEGKYIVAQDVAAWDLYFWYWFGLEFARKYIVSYRIEDEKIKREIVYLCIAHFLCYIIVRNKVYLFDGMTSGGPGTAHLNSAGNTVKNRWICKKILWDTLHVRLPLKEWVHIMTFGDDLHETIKKILASLQDKKLVFTTDVVTPTMVSKYAKEFFGHTHTTADKKEIGSWDTMETAEFLKRKHNKINGVIMPTMNLEDIKAHLMWVRKTDLPIKQQITENIHAALREFFFHGEKVFNEEKEKLNLYLRSIHTDNQFFETYQDLMVKYLNELNQ